MILIIIVTCIWLNYLHNKFDHFTATYTNSLLKTHYVYLWTVSATRSWRKFSFCVLRSTTTHLTCFLYSHSKAIYQTKRNMLANNKFYKFDSWLLSVNSPIWLCFVFHKKNFYDFTRGLFYKLEPMLWFQRNYYFDSEEPPN